MDKRQTILLADDSENDLFLMHRAFKQAEFNVALQEVRNGEQTIAYLKGEGVYSDRDQYPFPSLVLLDLNMPMKTGFDVLGWVRGQPAFKCLSLIILTASMRPSDVERAFDLGASAYLVKPSNIEALTAMLRCLRDWIRINHFPPLNDRMAR